MNGGRRKTGGLFSYFTAGEAEEFCFSGQATVPAGSEPIQTDDNQ